MQSHTRCHCLQLCLVSLGLWSHAPATGHGELSFLGCPPQAPSNPPTLQVRHLKLKTLKDLREVMQVVTRVLDQFKSRSDPLRRPRCPVAGMATEIQGIAGRSGPRWLHGGKQGSGVWQRFPGCPCLTVSRREGTPTLEGTGPHDWGGWLAQRVPVETWERRPSRNAPFTTEHIASTLTRTDSSHKADPPSGQALNVLKLKSLLWGRQCSPPTAVDDVSQLCPLRAGMEASGKTLGSVACSPSHSRSVADGSEGGR